MNKSYIALLLTIIAASWSGMLALASPLDDLTITSAVRTVDVTTPGILREKTTYAATANAQGANTFLIAVPQIFMSRNLSHIAVTEKRDKKGVDAVKLTLDDGVVYGDFRIYSAQLYSPLKSGEKTTLYLSTVLTGIVKPFPKVIDQTSKQLLMLSYNAYIDSPYKIEKQKTSVKLNNGNIINDASLGTRSGNIVSYGPFHDIKPNSALIFHLHYEDPKAILVAKRVSRELEVSHWGSSISTTEYWELHNKGAALKDSLFSRIDYQFTLHSHHMTNVVKEMRLTLPPKAAHVFYRDDIGNVSTSHFRKELKKSVLDIRPRYPLYGGWKYSWHHTYDIPLGDYLRHDPKTGRYILQVPFMGAMSNVSIEQAIFKIALPEGAREIKIFVPFTPDKQNGEPYFTNLDSIGRTMITIEKHNVADEYSVPLQISYLLDTSTLLRKPWIVSATIFGLFLLGMVFARLDLSIVDSKAKPS